MTSNLTVLDTLELNGKDNWYDCPPKCCHVTGHSCLTPEGFTQNLKQYKIIAQDTTDQNIYGIYALSHEDTGSYQFELPDGFTDGYLDHIPHVGEILMVQSRVLLRARTETLVQTSHKQLCLLPDYYCCTLDGNSDCYCFREDELPFMGISLHVVKCSERELQQYQTNSQ